MAREGSTGTITGTIIDGSGTGVAGDDLLTMTFTLYDYVTGTIINGREDINVLNANGATLSSASGSEGQFVVPIGVADNVILDSDRPSEKHVALFKFTGVGSAGSASLGFTVENIRFIG